MITRLVLAAAGAAVALGLPADVRAYEYEQEATTKLMTDMIVDLGGHDAVRRNSGKTVRCGDGGTRRVSIVRRGATTTYRGDYRNCRERGLTRDGFYEIVFKGDEIVSSTSKRSVNGELFDAAMEGNAAGVRKLIRARADVNYTESVDRTEGGTIDGVSPLMVATMAGSLDTVKLLVANGAWVNYLNSMAVNALWIAAHNGHPEIVRYLAGRGAYLNNSNFEDVTPLMAAAMNGHLAVVKFLVGAKADINAVHRDGDTALMFALAQNRTDIARFLIDAGADVAVRNRHGVTALLIAVAEGNEEIVRALLERKADVSARTADGKSALDVARARGMDGIAKLLEAAGSY